MTTQIKKTRLSSKGQLTIPKEVRDRHGWQSGIELILEDRGYEVILRTSENIPETTLEDLIGCTGYSGQRRSLEDMEEAIARDAKQSR